MNIDFFTKNVSCFFMEAEVHPDRAINFENKYSSTSGDRPVIGTGYQHQKNKWGTECRIYFNSKTDLSGEFSKLNIEIEKGTRPYKSEYCYRINNCEFFWSLVGARYKLGKNQV